MANGSAGSVVMAWYWLSTKKITVGIEVRDGIVVHGPPIVRRFVGQPASNLRRWLTRQGGFRWQEV